MISSAEIIEPLHSRARIARAVLVILHERLDDPPTVTELCEAVGAKERTLHLSCVEAFGRPPGTLLAELRLNAAHRALLHPGNETSVAAVAALYGFPISGDSHPSTGASSETSVDHVVPGASGRR